MLAVVSYPKDQKGNWLSDLKRLKGNISFNQLVDSVTEVVDNSNVQEFIVGYRFSPEEYEEPGIKMSDTLYLVDKLADKKLDYLHISLT